MRFTVLLPPPPPPPSSGTISNLFNLITSHPEPPTLSLLQPHLPTNPSPHLLSSLLSLLFSSHSPTTKSSALFHLSLLHPSHLPPSSSSLLTTLLSLSRARHFPSALSLLRSTATHHPSLLLSSLHHPFAILLSRHAKFNPYPDTIQLFHDLQHIWALAGIDLQAHVFVALLRAFCSRGRVADARHAFLRYHHRFPPDSKVLNTLLLGFKEAGDMTALDLFFHETKLRGFKPDAVSYNIRIDGYSKNGRFDDALELLDEMGRENLSPTVETFTTLIHGAGIARNQIRARRLFDDMCQRGLSPDSGAYNALMGGYVRVGDLKAGLEVMNEMEEKGFELDDVSYYTMIAGLKKYGNGLEEVYEMYNRMVGRGVVPRPRTLMLLMRLFCENRRSDMGLSLWDYLLQKGSCPHRHALDLLVTGLCCSGKVAEAYRCFKQFGDLGRWPSEGAFRVLEGFLVKANDVEKLEEISLMMKNPELL